MDFSISCAILIRDSQLPRALMQHLAKALNANLSLGMPAPSSHFILIIHMLSPETFLNTLLLMILEFILVLFFI